MAHVDLEALAADLFGAFERHDHEYVDGLMHPDAVIVQNGVSADWPTMRARIIAIRDLLGDQRYENVRRVVGDGAVVEEHDIVSTTPDGREVRMFACVVIRVAGDGRIREVTEYVDPTPLLGGS